MAVSSLPVYLNGGGYGSQGVIEEFGAGNLKAHQDAEGQTSLADFAGESSAPPALVSVTIKSGADVASPFAGSSSCSQYPGSCTSTATDTTSVNVVTGGLPGYPTGYTHLWSYVS